MRTTTPQDATIMGTDGFIRIHSQWWVPKAMTLHQAGKDPKLIELPFTGNGYNYEAAEVHACLRAGKIESDVMPLDETFAIMQTMDRIRASGVCVIRWSRDRGCAGPEWNQESSVMTGDS